MAIINPLLGSNLVTGAGPFDSTLIGNSVWLDGSSDQLEMAKTSGGSASSKFTVSCWIQRNEFTEGTFTGIFGHFFSSNTGVQLSWLNDNTLTWIVFSSTSGAGGQITSSGVFRDIGWYHILGNYDGVNGRMELFVNGESIGVDTFTAGSTNPIGSGTSGAAYYWGAIKNTAGTFGRTNSYLAQCALELGTAAVPSDYVDTFTFGTNGSQVIPKTSSNLVARINSAGGHSHLLDFSTSSDLGNDASSNNNDFTATNMSSANQSVHTPSLSYPVFNALCPRFTDGGTWSEGNTKIVATSEATNAITTLPPISTGKYYFQWVFTDNASSGNCAVGMTPISHWNGDYVDPFFAGDIFYADHRNGNFTKGSTTVNSILGSSGTYALCFDLDAGKVWVGLVDTSDGSISWYNSSGGTTGDPANGNNPTATFTANTSMVPFTVIGKAAGTSWTVDWNFGQFGFGNSAVPTGFEQITSAKITAPTHQGIDHFNAVNYTGNGTAIGSGGKAVTGVGFSPSWVWIKDRDATSGHILTDSVRGATKDLRTHLTSLEGTNTEMLSSFDSDGFTVGSNANVNASSNNIISWNWKAGGAAASNGTGSITSSVSVATPGHFSIVGYQGNSTPGATVGHSLGGTPELIIFRGRGGTGASSFLWRVFSTVGGAGKYLRLNDTTALQDDTGYLNNTLPNETVFTLGTDGDVNNSNYNYIAYCFRSVPGVCKIGSYEGNNNADGSYVSLGFKPSFFISKNIDATGSWFIIDNKRGFNSASNEAYLQAESNATETVGNVADLLSEAIKWRTTGGGNANNTFIYMAMADIASGAGLAPIYGR